MKDGKSDYNVEDTSQPNNITEQYFNNSITNVVMSLQLDLHQSIYLLLQNKPEWYYSISVLYAIGRVKGTHMKLLEPWSLEIEYVWLQNEKINW